jgi:hypothetical protein
MATLISHELVETVSDYMYAWYFDDGALDEYGNSIYGDLYIHYKQ